jgi:hypothetical protein
VVEEEVVEEEVMMMRTSGQQDSKIVTAREKWLKEDGVLPSSSSSSWPDVHWERLRVRVEEQPMHPR